MNAIIKSCRNYDRTAQRKLVDMISPMLYTICLRYVGQNHLTTKDLVQESLIIIFNNIDRCQANTEIPFRAWCKRIAINVSLGALRKNTIPTTEIDLNAVKIQSTQNIDSKLNVQDILQLLSSIPKQHRLVFNLAVLDGYSHKEIAKMLNIKESSSRTFLTRARQSLQKLIRSQDIKLQNVKSR